MTYSTPSIDLNAILQPLQHFFSSGIRQGERFLILDGAFFIAIQPVPVFCKHSTGFKIHFFWGFLLNIGRDLEPKIPMRSRKNVVHCKGVQRRNKEIVH